MTLESLLAQEVAPMEVIVAATRNSGARAASGEYLFFVELEGHQADSRLKNALTALGRKTVKLEVLGSYARSEAVE